MRFNQTERVRDCMYASFLVFSCFFFAASFRWNVARPIHSSSSVAARDAPRQPCGSSFHVTLLLPILSYSVTRAPLHHFASESSRRSGFPIAPASLNQESTSSLTSAPQQNGPAILLSARSARFRAHARDLRARARATALGFARENLRVADTGHAPGDLSGRPDFAAREPA